MLTVQGKITGEDVPQQQPVAQEKGLECRENRQGGETCTIRCMARHRQQNSMQCGRRGAQLGGCALHGSCIADFVWQ
jgi:hypothetical protein